MNSGQSSPQAVNEKPSSFLNRIAAFNKTIDAPLAPRALPKPTSFVRKPFIPPPPSKESYYAPPKPAQLQRPATQVPFAETRELTSEATKQTADEPPPEPEISKERMKERILAIQKGLDYTVKPPAPPPRRTESHSELDELPQTHSEEELSDSDGEEDEPEPHKPAIKPVPEPPTVNREFHGELVHVESEKEDPSKAEEDVETHEPEIDPEVARRIAIRERMAKMSGGMGMHMGLGMGPPPAFSKSKASTQPPISPPSSPATERRPPIPILPGLPPITPKEPERQTSGSLHEEDRKVEPERRSSYIKASDSSHHRSLELERATTAQPIEESFTSIEHPEAEEPSEEEELEEAKRADLPGVQKEETSDDEDPAPPVSAELADYGRSNPMSLSQPPR